MVALLWWGSAHAEPQALPSLGDGVEMSAGAERRLGEQVARELYRDPDYVDDPILSEYVQQIWQRLLAAARARGELSPELDERFSWEILLGRDRSLNAFALPGGYLGLHLGLIGAVSRPDELAAVLAHELSHVTQRHISRVLGQQGRQTPLLMAAMLLAVVAASKNPDAAQALMVGGQAAAAQSQLSFSRDMEREADRVGWGVMTQAGFDPQGFVSMFEKLQQSARLNDSEAYPYLRSHPLTTERIADMQGRAWLGQGERPAIADDVAHAMLSARARVLTTPGVDVLRLWAQTPDGPDFAQQSRPQQAAALYAATLASAELRDFAQAQRWANALLALVRGGPQTGVDRRNLKEAERQACLLMVDVALRAPTTAGLPKATALLLREGGAATRRDELLMLAQAEVRSDHAPRAVERLQPWVAQHPRDAFAWQVLAAAWGQERQPLRAIRAEGEVQLARLDYAGAVDRFNAAREVAERATGKNQDLIELSVIDALLHQAQALLREQQKNTQQP
jgi:predicted Zn-dependent protease